MIRFDVGLGIAEYIGGTRVVRYAVRNFAGRVPPALEQGEFVDMLISAASLSMTSEKVMADVEALSVTMMDSLSSSLLEEVLFVQACPAERSS